MLRIPYIRWSVKVFQTIWKTNLWSSSKWSLGAVHIRYGCYPMSELRPDYREWFIYISCWKFCNGGERIVMFSREGKMIGIWKPSFLGLEHCNQLTFVLHVLVVRKHILHWPALLKILKWSAPCVLAQWHVMSLKNCGFSLLECWYQSKMKWKQ